MGLFSSIAEKIFHHGGAANTQTASASPTSAPASAGGASAAAPASTPASPSAPAASQPVDVEAVLTDMASKKGGGGNWQSSIVDLLKLLDLDSSMSARKELGDELNTHTGADGSAEQNIALHRAVMQKLAENGGKVPDSLKH